MILLDATTGSALFDVLMNNPIIDNAMKSTLNKVVALSTMIGITLYFIGLGYNYAKSVMDKMQGGEETGFIDIKELIRTLVLLGCILVYPILADGLVATMNLFRYMSSPAGNQYAAFTEVGRKYAQYSEGFNADLNELMIDDVLQNPGDYDTTTVTFARMEKSRFEQARAEGDPDFDNIEGRQNRGFLKWLVYLNPNAWPSLAIKSIIGFLSSAIKYIVGIIATYMLKIFIVLGPLALAFSILPMFKGKLEEWFGTVLTLGFVFVTYNILDMIFYAHMSGIVNDPAIIAGGTAHNNPTVTFAFDLAYLIAYIMVFWITSKYVGKGDAGRFMTKAVGLATIGAMLLMSGGAAAAGKSSQTLGNIASTAGDTFKGEE
jgi:hypothetical protein